MSHSYKATADQPFHLSVGTVLFNDKGQIAIHHFPEMGETKDLLLLMRETLDPGETLEAGVSRGLMEEFGATGEPEVFLGSVVSFFDREGINVQKTTLYFLVRMKSFDPESRDPNDPERHSALEWWDPTELMATMKTQGDASLWADESTVIERALPFLPK